MNSDNSPKFGSSGSASPSGLSNASSGSPLPPAPQDHAQAAAPAAPPTHTPDGHRIQKTVTAPAGGGSGGGLVLLGLAAAALAIGGYLYSTKGGSADREPQQQQYQQQVVQQAPAVAAAVSGDPEISADEQARRLLAWKSMNLKTVPVGDKVAIQQIGDSGLVAGSAYEYTKMKVFVWDDCAQDGDIVTLTAGGVSKTSHLTNAGEWLEFPKDSKIVIHGDYDGGGGITLGVKGEDEIPHSPVMQPGEDLILNVH